MKDKIILNFDEKTGIVLGKTIISSPDEGEEESQFSQANMLKASMKNDDVEVVSDMDIGVSIDMESYFDNGRPAKQVSIDPDNIPKLSRNFGRTFREEDAPRYRYTEDKGLHIRPYFTIEILNPQDAIKLTSEISVFPLNTPVELRAKYNDPDDVGFIDKFRYIKLKDYYDFIDLPNTLPALNKQTKVYDFKIESEFPGVCNIRVKDENYLCNSFRFPVRFKKGRK